MKIFSMCAFFILINKKNKFKYLFHASKNCEKTSEILNNLKFGDYLHSYNSY